MTKRTNDFNTKMITMCPVISIIEPTTQAKLQLKVEIQFFPDRYLPDYIEVQNNIRLIIDNKKLSVEAAAQGIINLYKEYEPSNINVVVTVATNNTFSLTSVYTSYTNLENQLEASENSIDESVKPRKKPDKKADNE